MPWAKKQIQSVPFGDLGGKHTGPRAPVRDTLRKKSNLLGKGACARSAGWGEKDSALSANFSAS